MTKKTYNIAVPEINITDFLAQYYDVRKTEDDIKKKLNAPTTTLEERTALLTKETEMDFMVKFNKQFKAAQMFPGIKTNNPLKSFAKPFFYNFNEEFEAEFIARWAELPEKKDVAALYVPETPNPLMSTSTQVFVTSIATPTNYDTYNKLEHVAKLYDYLKSNIYCKLYAENKDAIDAAKTVAARKIVFAAQIASLKKRDEEKAAKLEADKLAGIAQAPTQHANVPPEMSYNTI